MDLRTGRCFHRLCVSVNDEGEVISFRRDSSCYYFEAKILSNRSVNTDVYKKRKQRRLSQDNPI